MSDTLYGINIDDICNFIISKGGKVTNHELVKHFKEVLTNENTREEARHLFKEVVNKVANITRDADGKKQLVLKKQYRKTPTLENQIYSSTATLPSLSLSPETPLNLRYTPVYQQSHHDISLSSPIGDTLGSPLSLKSPPNFNRRTSQESIKSTISAGTYATTDSVAPSSSSSSSTASTSSTISSNRQPSYKTASTTSSTSSISGVGEKITSAVIHRRPSSSSSLSLSLSSVAAASTSTTISGGALQRQTSNDSMHSTTSSEVFLPATSSFMMSDGGGGVQSSPPPPPVPPRRKSSDKIQQQPRPYETARIHQGEMKTSMSQPNLLAAAAVVGQHQQSSGNFGSLTSMRSSSTLPDLDNKENVANISKISVKERSQKFDRMASESALNKAVLHNSNNNSINNNKKKHDKTNPDKDEEDTGSVQLLDGKSREWLVRCAQGDYQALVKLAAENPKLVKFKDPTSGYTALHWGAKHGNLDIIKLIAGTHKAYVNARSNGGYTPLHIATQFGHEEACAQLVKVYKADENIRDYSGRKPRQYQKTSGTSISADTFRKIKARKKHAAEKDLGFLRIGSLNVRVKRTTEAFSNFLGVGGNTDKLHKHWGSADNIPQGEQKRMPPPQQKISPIKKRKSKRAQDFSMVKPITTTTTTAAAAAAVVEQHPAGHVAANLTPRQISLEVNPNDSDSDTAAGFGSTWQSTV